MTEKNTNANWITSAIAQCIGMETKQPGYIPSVRVGDSIYLDNGVAGQKYLSRDEQVKAALLSQQVLYLPVISGDPPYNQSRTCIGFIAVRVTDVQVNNGNGDVEAINCLILKSFGPGLSGTKPTTGNAANDAALANWHPSAIKMVH